jgi:cellulose synthase/poly-beta-1,6-N-acetylglucosamine synthase-like glycosyltransferase
MNTAGVPVLFKVETIFCAMIALFPIPVTIILPFEKNYYLYTVNKILPDKVFQLRD